MPTGVTRRPGLAPVLTVGSHKERTFRLMDASQILLILGLIFVNGFFVAAEFALVKVRTSQIDQMVEEGNWAAKMTSKALDHLDAYLSASQLGITVASLALGYAIEKVIAPIEHGLSMLGLAGENWTIGSVHLPLASILAFSFVTFLHMAMGEQAPKSLAIGSAKTIALWTAPVLIAFYYLFFPFIWLLNNASQLTLRLIGLGRADHGEVTTTEEELRHILAESVKGGHLTRTERIMIENVLNLEEKTARRVMVPRPDIVYLSLSRPIEDNLRIARQAGHTRYPLCEDDLTTVIGMIHVKDLFRAGTSASFRPDLRKASRPTPFLPASLRLNQLLGEFQKNQVHLAMLLDEYGSLVGMVSLENVLEELVGPIQDEFDRETPLVVALGHDTFEVDATCPLDILAETLHVELPETDAETAGGLILDLLGRMAHPGDSVVIDEHRLVVVRAEPNRIRTIRVERVVGATPMASQLPEPSPNPDLPYRKT